MPGDKMLISYNARTTHITSLTRAKIATMILPFLYVQYFMRAFG
jgi:hypothetical protein